jgi:4-phosphopantoate--beta-alanine ligase
LSHDVPKSHPRYLSLLTREKIITGMEEKVVAPAGLIAHGRGEAYDYLFGEDTQPFARQAIRAAAASLLLAEHPVLSVNGNVAALCPEGFVELSEAAKAAMEVNLFYRLPGRLAAIEKALRDAGAGVILGLGDGGEATLHELESDRRIVDPRGIAKADWVFVPLEDGDRTEVLVKTGKTVVTVDLNPLSRTARKAHITIVDNIIRVMPLLKEEYLSFHGNREEARKVMAQYDNSQILSQSLSFLKTRLEGLSKELIDG